MPQTLVGCTPQPLMMSVVATGRTCHGDAGRPAAGAVTSGASRSADDPHTNGDRSGGSHNSLGRLSLAFGLLGVATCWIGIGGLAGIAAVILGVLGRSRARRMHGVGGGIATAGLALGVLSALIALLLVGGSWTFYEQHGDDLRRYQDCRKDPNQDPAVCRQRFNDVIGGSSGSSR